MKFIFQNTHENNRLSVKNCSHVLQFKVFWDYDSTIIKRSRRSGFTTSLQKFWTVFHFFLVYSTSRFIDTFSEVTDSGSDTASQQSNFFENSILLEVSNISMLGTLRYKFIWNSFLQSPGPGCCHTQAMVCELTLNSSVYWTISIQTAKCIKKILWDHFLRPNAYNLLFPLKLTIIRILVCVILNLYIIYSITLF